MDPLTAFEKKLSVAPAAEIIMNGDDIKDWETTGLDPRGDPDTKWKINLDEDGMVTWSQMDEDTPDYGDEFFIQGTHNNWMPEALERHDSIIGLWMSTLSIGS